MTPARIPARVLVGPALRAQPDRRLVMLAREGHGPALEEVVRRYRPALVRYAATIVPPDRADDVVQDAIARALPKIRDGEAELNLRPWLYTIVRNTALNSIRDAGPAMDHLDENFDGVEQPPQALERREELAAVLAGVQALPDTQREALIKREMEGRSHREIGEAMGVSVAAARQLIHRGRIALREGLGVLVPMPVMRQLLDGMGAPAAAGTGAGGALAAKALVGVLALGGAVGAGVALHRHSHPSPSQETIIAEHHRSAMGPGGGGGANRAGSPQDRLKGNGRPGSTGSSRNGGGADSNRGSSDGSSSVGASGVGSGHSETASGGHGPSGSSGSGDAGHGGGGDGEHHGGSGGGDNPAEPSGGEHQGGGDGSGGGGSGDTSGGTDDGSGGGGSSGPTSEPSGHEGSGDGSSGHEGSSGSDGTELVTKPDSGHSGDD